jgi:DNA-binding XRE family transcriptional regulator
MSANAVDLTTVTPQMVITETEFNELNRLKALLTALNITNADDLSIGQIIRTRRAIEGLTAKELAEKAGVDRGHLTKVENDEIEIRHATIRKLDTVFGPAFSKAVIGLKK